MLFSTSWSASRNRGWSIRRDRMPRSLEGPDLQLAPAQSRFQQAPHTPIYPSIFLAVTVLSLITLGDILRAAVNPRRRR